MHTQNQKEQTMKLDTEGLSTAQVKILKQLHSLIANVLTTDDESEYFEMSAELLKKTSELIKQSNFAVENKNISYGEQAVEFAVDSLHEEIQDKTNFDN